MDMARIPAVRKAWYAGTWYAAEPDNARATIIEAIDEAREHANKTDGTKGALLAVLPHAGLTYSARGIAHLILHAPVPIRRVLILSPSHHVIVPEDTLSFGLFSGFDTPLGRLESFKTALETHGPDATAAIQREHAVEMVMPFLAYLQEKQGSPIAIATALISHISSVSHARRLARQLMGLLDQEGTMIIASSDFTHYGSRFGHTPFGSHVNAHVVSSVRSEDVRVATLLAHGQIDTLVRDRNTICGIAGAMKIGRASCRERV